MTKSLRKKPQRILQKIPLQVTTELIYKIGLVPRLLTYEDDDEGTVIFNPVKGLKLIDGAVRWRCRINGREIELFNEGESWWAMQ